MTCKNRQALSLLIGATLTLFLIVVGQVADVAAAAATSDRRVTWMRAQGICTKRDCNCTINPQKLIFIKCTFGDQVIFIGYRCHLSRIALTSRIINENAEDFGFSISDL
ncbi:hypothetical protein TKK_0009334 [Trichogramma kaykai]